MSHFQSYSFVCGFLGISFLQSCLAVIEGPIKVKVGVVLNYRSTLTMDYINIEPVMKLAYARSLAQHNVLYESYLALYEGGCQELGALGQTVRALNNSVDMIFGPGCTDDVVAVAKLTTVYKVPLMTGAGSMVDSTDLWPYVTRTAYNTRTQWGFFGMICQQFNWTNVFVAYEADISQYFAGAQNLMKSMRNRLQTPADYPLRSTDSFGLKKAGVLLQEAALRARVIVLLMTPKKSRTVLVQASRRGMCNGEYIIFVLDALRTDILDSKDWRKNNDDDQEVTCEMLFIITLRFSRNSPQFRNFRRDILKAAVVAPGAQPPDVNYYSSTFHDALVIFAAIVNESVTEGHPLNAENADYIANKFASRNFTGAVNAIYLNKDGDRDDDYEVFQMIQTTPDDYKFSAVAVYTGYRDYLEFIRPVKWLNSDGSPVANRPLCDFDGNGVICLTAARTALGGALGGVSLIVILFCAIGIAVYRYHEWRTELNNLDWLAAWSEIYIHSRSGSNRSISVAGSLHAAQDPEGPPAGTTTTANALTNGVKNFVQRAKSIQSIQKSSATSRRTGESKTSMLKTNTIVASFRSSVVLLRPCEGVHIELTGALRNEVRLVKSLSTCENLLKFVAACVEADHVTILGEYCSRGTLQDVLQNDTMTLDWVFRFSFISDIVSAMLVLHASTLVQHGRLTSRCCYIDKRFVLKVGDFGLPSFYDEVTTPIEPTDLLWSAPEVLRAKAGLSRASPDGDIFAFAIILQEIVMRESPYFLNNLSAEEIIGKVKRGERPIFRPVVQDSFCPEEIMYLMKSCWAEDPAERPKLAQIRASLRNTARANGKQKENIIDTLIERMEQYAASLEVSVDEKTQALVEEKKKTEQLLYSILPRPIAEQLKRGDPVLPESYDSVTIYFGDIVEFTTLSAASSPIEIVTLMNDLYSSFDQIIGTFDAYKVETIGDCYVIVSGLPHRNGQKHAGIIARLAITLRDAVPNIKVRHMPESTLQLRIGLNSGPCVAGVVGFATPRYCLFGDTVNVASRMESTGEAMRIQVTQTTENLLRSLGSFETEPRGVITIKGKGDMNTFWLIGTHRPHSHSTTSRLG